SAAAVLEQILVALVRLFGRSKPREHAHRPELAAVACGVNAARVGCFARVAEILFSVPIFGKIGGGVEAANRNVRNRAESRVTLIVEISASRGTDGLFRRLLDRGGQSLFRPLSFVLRGMAFLKHVGDWTFRDLRLGIRFLLLGHALP